MTETPSVETAAAKKPAKKAGGLNSMLLADLKSMAAGLGIAGAGSMKKALRDLGRAPKIHLRSRRCGIRHVRGVSRVGRRPGRR